MGQKQVNVGEKKWKIENFKLKKHGLNINRHYISILNAKLPLIYEIRSIAEIMLHRDKTSSINLDFILKEIGKLGFTIQYRLKQRIYFETSIHL